MKLIPLSKGAETIVDDADYEWLSSFKWHLGKGRHTDYAVRTQRIGSRKENKKKTIIMHRLIIGALPGEIVDHWDLNGLNNQRDNLRRCTNGQNHYNGVRYSNNTSGHKGVSWNKYAKKWEASIAVNNVELHLGYFTDADEAAEAYAEAAKQYHGEFARTE